MAHLDPKDPNEIPQLSAVLSNAEATMGFIPNSMLTMAHMPQLGMAFSMLAGVVFGADLKSLMSGYADAVPDSGDAADNLPASLVQLIAFSVSTAAGCRYCQAHTSNNLVRFGGAAEQLQDILNYEDSDAFEDSERAVIGLALAAGGVPNTAEAAHFDALKRHFNERQITQIVAVISLFGFLNRWNDTMATQLEEHPVAFAESHLSGVGWSAGKHAG